MNERIGEGPAARVLVASNRGPVSFRLEADGTLSARRGGGGLVSGISAAGLGSDAVWVCAAMSDADREAARRSPGGRLDRSDLLPGDGDGQGLPVRLLDIPPEVFTDGYNGIANSVLWFVHHMLYDTPVEPAFDAHFATQWENFRAYNEAFARALAEEAGPDAVVLVQDYHLVLVPGLLRALRPDLRVGHFSHTPWAPVDYFRMLPDAVAREVLLGILGADRAGFLTERWARAFAACCRDLLAAEVREAGAPDAAGDGRDLLEIVHEGRTTRIGVHGLGADAAFLTERSRRPDVDARMAVLREQVGDRRMLVRVDRTELSKNIVRGLLAYQHLLRTRPEWHGRVVHVAFAYPSRQDLASYRHYTAEVRRLADAVNAEFGTEDWTPLLLHVEDDFARSLAAYRMADVAVVNPIRDGMNLVAKEIPVVSDAGCALVLSREAGAYAELGEDALGINPYDVVGTAEAMHQALSMPPEERSGRSKRLAEAAAALPPARWFMDQLEALG
ncbi:alpha,alpha-trehalose-phosphate synthase (UDP-forming) [Allostreptomyces psammosilenae]|uniref:Trehalose 6-phosphate synthase n=1 Tax=Allostreptomyces psammosilenae TaxID=1892865 RepID=A0A853AAU0_9ACTN|nr:trehalose-6-phosphate synthase [Allostreptomyces psammosilenae]NYI07628.1 trehalose 6-phosphate synthase [Allostreptomyces psammosilenae]